MPHTSLVIAMTAVTLLLHSEAAAKKAIIGMPQTPTIVARIYQAPDQFLLPVNLPHRRGQQFSKLSISFTEAAQDRVAVIPVNLATINAFLGNSDNPGDRVAIQSTWVDETGVLWVEFDQPVRSGTNLTLTLNTRQLPAGATFRYGIAAYPATRNPVPVFVGDGTIGQSRKR